MTRTEADFIKELENRAKAQQVLAETEIIPSWAKGIGGWLAVNPWRVLVPVSVLAYGLLRMAYGESLRELVLGLFGGY